MTNRGKKSPWVASACLCLCFAGCAGTNTFLVSNVAPEQVHEGISKVGKITLRGTSVVIRPVNAVRTAQSAEILVSISSNKFDPKHYFFSPIYYQNPRLDTQDPFIVEILLSTGSQAAVFDAMALTIKDEKGNSRSAISVYNLAPRYSTARFVDPVTPLCKHPDKLPASVDYPLLSQFEKTSDGPVHLSKNGLYCFAVKFNIPPIDPRTKFSVTLDGLSIDGQKVHVPSISFVTDTFTQKTR